MDIQVHDRQERHSLVHIGRMFMFKHLPGVYLRASDKQYIQLTDDSHNVYKVGHIFTAVCDLDTYQIYEVVPVGQWKVERA